jgi:hypothetical protein
MRKGLISVLVLAAASLTAVDSASPVSTCLLASSTCGWPALQPTLDVSVAPRGLPANEYAPAAWNVFGKVETSDGTHPPALREAIVDIDRDVRVNAGDYRSCTPHQIDALDAKAAAKACHAALVGRGKATVEVAFPEVPPNLLSGRLLVFNGGERGGVAKLLIHAFTPQPTSSPILTVVKITRKSAGLQAVVKIPVIANGSGSLLDLDFRIGKTYSYRGRKVGYFEAKCPDGVFKANVKLLFKNEAKTPEEAAATSLKGALAVPCTGKG